MLRLATILYSIVATTTVGILIIIALVAGYDTLRYILIAAAAGAVLALPISYFVASAIKAED